MNSGVIVEVKSKYSIVLSGGQFIRITNKGEMERGTPILFTDEDIYAEVTDIKAESTRQRIMNQRIWIASAAVFIIAIVGLTFMNQPQKMQTYALVTAEINPAVEFSLGANGRVIDLKALNLDGESVIDFAYKDETLEHALVSYVEQVKKRGFIKTGETPQIKLTYIEKLPLDTPMDFEKVVQALENLGFEVELVLEDDTQTTTTEQSTTVQTTAVEPSTVTLDAVEPTTEPTALDVVTEAAEAHTTASVRTKSLNRSIDTRTSKRATSSFETTTQPQTTKVVTIEIVSKTQEVVETERITVQTEEISEPITEIDTEPQTNYTVRDKVDDKEDDEDRPRKKKKKKKRKKEPIEPEQPDNSTTTGGGIIIIITTQGGITIEIPIESDELK